MVSTISSQPHLAAENLAGVLHADLLHQLLLRVIELVHVAVDMVEVHVLVIKVQRELVAVGVQPANGFGVEAGHVIIALCRSEIAYFFVIPSRFAHGNDGNTA
jgi:hypothetical protein